MKTKKTITLLFLLFFVVATFSSAVSLMSSGGDEQRKCAMKISFFPFLKAEGCHYIEGSPCPDDTPNCGMVESDDSTINEGSKACYCLELGGEWKMSDGAACWARFHWDLNLPANEQNWITCTGPCPGGKSCKPAPEDLDPHAPPVYACNCIEPSDDD